MSEGIIDLRKVLLLNPTNKELVDILKLRVKDLKETKAGKLALVEDIETLVAEVGDRLLTEVFYQNKK